MSCQAHLEPMAVGMILICLYPHLASPCFRCTVAFACEDVHFVGRQSVKALTGFCMSSHAEPCRFLTWMPPEVYHQLRGMKLLKSNLLRKSTFTMGGLQTSMIPIWKMRKLLHFWPKKTWRDLELPPVSLEVVGEVTSVQFWGG